MSSNRLSLRSFMVIICALMRVSTVWVGSTQAASRSGGPVSCSNGALVQTHAHASGWANFRHYQNTAQRGDMFWLAGGGNRTYTSGYASIYRPAAPSAAWEVWNGPLEFIGSARSACSPPA